MSCSLADEQGDAGGAESDEGEPSDARVIGPPREGGSKFFERVGFRRKVSRWTGDDRPDKDYWSDDTRSVYERHRMLPLSYYFNL